MATKRRTRPGLRVNPVANGKPPDTFSDRLVFSVTCEHAACPELVHEGCLGRLLPRLLPRGALQPPWAIASVNYGRRLVAAAE
jgi:hypothetical protein